MKKIIKDYIDYEIYDNGEVFSKKTQKFLNGSIGENGYKYYRLSKNGKKKMFYAHRLVAEHFLENLNNYPVVNHIDGNKLNNNVNNLEWTTYSNNTEEWHKNSSVKRRKTQLYDGDYAGEKWVEIPGSLNYKISTCGRIWNTKTNNILKPVITCGYYKVSLSINGKRKDYLVHKLVYSIFNNDYNILKNEAIDHIDGNKLNNNVNNLRKISLSENVKAALYKTKTNKSCKAVNQYTLDGIYIQTFASVREAARELNLDSSVISKVCRNDRYKSTGGFIFKYIE